MLPRQPPQPRDHPPRRPLAHRQQHVFERPPRRHHLDRIRGRCRGGSQRRSTGIPERPEPLGRLARHRRGGRGGTACRAQLRQPGAHRGHARHVRAGDVRRFAPVARQVVELRARRLDHLPALVDERAGRTPARQPWVMRLGVDVAHDDWCVEPDAVETLGHRDAGEAEDGGHHVDETHRAVVASRDDPVTGNDERHAQRTVVEQHAVRGLAVLAEALSVVARDNHDLRATRVADRGEQAGHLGIDVGDFSIVGHAARAGEMLSRWCIRHVRIVEVHPEEDRCRRWPCDAAPPRDGAIDHLAGRTFGLEPFRRPRLSPNPIVVLVEAAREPEPAIEHVGADERAGAVSSGPEGRGERGNTPVEAMVAVDPHAVRRRGHPRHDAGVGRERQRCHGARVREPASAVGEAVQGGCDVGAQPVGAPGVDGDQDDVWPHGCAGPWRLAARRHHGRGQDHTTHACPTPTHHGAAW
jgi:hypothetical protein